MYRLLFGKDFPQLWEDMCHKPGCFLSRLVFLLGPWFTFWSVELLNKSELLKDFESWQLLFNMVWYYIIFAAWRLVLGRLRRAAVAASVSCFAFGLVNHYVLRFRGRILFPADISGWRTAANVLDGFDLTADLWVKQAAIVLVAYLFFVAVCPAQKKREKLPRMGGAILTISIVTYTLAFFFTNMLPALNIYTQQWNTQKNGFLFNFSIALRYSRVEKPQDYSRHALAELMEQFPSVEGDTKAVRPTNLIVVMNEAFADMTVYDGLEVSEDPTPFLHSMDEDTVRGWLIPPVTGGGTAATEFEFLTGLSNGFLPPHCVAYQLYVKETVPALSKMMGELGYETTAFHPYRASGWNRPVVYDYMEFDVQLYETDVTDKERVRNYISDRCNYEKVFSLTEQAGGDPAFIFNVTMQNHSGYAQGWRNLTPWVTLSGEQDKLDPDARQYFALMRESDDALRGLIEYYEQVEEPTMVVFFGDHQPSLKREFLNAISGVEEGAKLTAEQNLQRYAVPFFIWTNYDIPEQRDVVLSSNFLGAKVAQMAGLPQSGWMNFLSQLSEIMPVVSPAGYVTADGQITADTADLPPEQRQWLLWYEQLCYCGLRDMSEETKMFFDCIE
ncbi:MAG: LTA synthase family protein [Oscillospiraceae bacterium]|nr:LTA synthase family protein [Oscillospiraceae bacterium]